MKKRKSLKVRCYLTKQNKINSEGRLVYDSDGNPVKEPGFIERQLRKIPNLLKNITLPGSPFASKPQAPPLGSTPMPMKMASNVQQKNQLLT